MRRRGGTFEVESFVSIALVKVDAQKGCRNRIGIGR